MIEIDYTMLAAELQNQNADITINVVNPPKPSWLERFVAYAGRNVNKEKV